MNSENEMIEHVYGDARNRKKRQKRQKLLMAELLTDFAESTSLHGLGHIVNKRLYIVERVFWFIIVITSLIICSFYIHNVVRKWKTSPIIVTVNGRLSSVGSVPFPSVTICPHVKVNPQVYNYTSKLEMYQDNESLWFGRDFDKYVHIKSMCDSVDDTASNQKKIHTNLSFVEDITEAAPSLEDIFFMCSLHDAQISDCEKIFQKVITEDGVCYTANSLAARDIFENTVQQNYSYMDSNISQSGWSLYDGYNLSSEYFFPKRGRAFGANPDLTVILVNDPDKADSSCAKIFSGYKIYLHHPADYPQTSMYSYAALPNQLSSLAISFHEFNTDEHLISYDPEIRQCYFPSDRKLKYFKIYTATNCLAECLSNYTYRMCNCVGFYMPHNNTNELCHPDKFDCISEARDFMALQERMSFLGLHEGGCRCLPACNTIDYDAEILKTDFQFREYLKENFHFFKYSPLTTYSKIDLFYKKPQFMAMQRSELFGVTDMLANIGGLLGVFLGFSFLSMVEMFYFMTIRAGFVMRRDRKEEKSKQALETEDRIKMNRH